MDADDQFRLNCTRYHPENKRIMNCTGNTTGRFNIKDKQNTSLMYHSALGFTGIMIVFLNSYVLSIFFRRRKIRSKTNFPLMSLALADMLSGLVNIPLLFSADILLEARHQRSWLVLILSDLSTVLCAATTMSSLFIAVAIRYVSICHPMVYLLVKRNRVTTSIAIAWMMSLVAALVRIQWLYPLFTTQKDSDSKRAIDYDKKYYLTTTGLYVFMLLCLTYFFLHMLVIIGKAGNFVRKMSSASRVSTRSGTSYSGMHNPKALLLFGAMFMMFLISWTPLTVLRLISVLDISIFSRLSLPVIHSIVIVRFASSVINPLLYTLFKQDVNLVFREDCRSIRKQLACCPRMKNGNASSGRREKKEKKLMSKNETDIDLELISS